MTLASRRARVARSVPLMAALVLATAPLEAEKSPLVKGPVEETGALDGARFHIAIPQNWNGGLVMYMHGYSPPESRYPPFPGEEGYTPRPPGTTIEFPAAALRFGYAVARSAYSRQGMALEEGVTETDALRSYFQRKYGKTYPTLIAGGHNGGLMAYDAIERYADHYDGGLAIGGIGGPKLEWLKERAFDLRVLFDYLYPETPGSVVEFPEGQTWRNFRPQLEAIIARDPDRARPLLDLYDLSSNADLARCVNLYTSILGDLYQNRARGNAFDNTNTVYTGFPDDGAVNRGVERYQSDPEAVAYVKEWNSPTCRLRKPMLAVNALRDPVVPVRDQQRYAEMCEREGRSHLFVQTWMDQASPAPSDEGMAYLLGALTDWVVKGTRPTPGELPQPKRSGGASQSARLAATSKRPRSSSR